MSKHISFVIPSLEIGGAERVVSLFADSLVRRNYKVSIVCLMDKIEFPLNNSVQVITPNFQLSRSPKGLFKTILYQRRVIKELNPDVIYSFLEFYNEITMLSVLGLKFKIFLFDRNSPFMKTQNFMHKILRKLLYPLANGVVVQTERSKSILKPQKLNKNIYVLPNPISKLKKVWIPNNNKTITTVGSLVHQKNQKYLIKVFSELKFKDWKLNIVGGGLLGQKLQDYIDELGMEENIKLLGKRNDVQEILSQTTVFAFPSLWEGFPNALLEAVALGVPSISNNCDTGPAEIIDNDINGFLVDVGNEIEFGNKLQELMVDEEKRLKFSSNGQLLREKFSLERVLKKLLEFST